MSVAISLIIDREDVVIRSENLGRLGKIPFPKVPLVGPVLLPGGRVFARFEPPGAPPLTLLLALEGFSKLSLFVFQCFLLFGSQVQLSIF